MAERSRSDTIQLKARMKEPLRAKLEAAAEAKGKSLNAEMVHRLERSFLNDDAGDREFGGRELRALFRMMGAAAQIIEERTGRACSADYETAKAARSAWAKIASNFAPRTAPDYFVSFDLPPIGTESPPAPEMPKYPRGRGLRSPPPSPEALKKFERDMAAYEKQFAKWKKGSNERIEKYETYFQHQKSLEELGREVATGLFPPRESGD